MTDFQTIINTEIINTETDVFWYNNSASHENIIPKNVLILSKKIDEQSAEQQQLNKILDACKLAEDKYNVVQFTENERLAWHRLKDTASPSVIILFGVHPSLLGISALFRLNALNNFDGASWIPTLSLQELEQQPQAKKDLWTNALKPLFADTQ